MSTPPQARLVEVFRSSRKAEMYLYVDKAQGVDELPEALKQQFGRAESVMTLLLQADRKLARVDAAEVLEAIARQGFFLQMPPAPSELRRREQGDD